MIANSTVLDHLSTSSSIGANNCTQLGIVKAGGSINIEECANVSSISAGMHIELRQSKVLGDVSSKANATIVNSQINGKLTCCSDHLVIEGSKIEMIDLRVSNNISINGTGIRVNGSTVSISSTSGNSSISLSNDVGASVSISTGSNGIIVNGVPLSKLQAESSSNADKKKKKQIIELKNCTIKDIIFEGGNGQVILAEGSNITGNITGGQIKE